MQFLCKRKIGIHSSTSSHEDPTVRLPREFKTLVGETAAIYVGEEKSKLVFKIIIDKKVDNFCTNSENSELENRVFDLETEIKVLRSFFIKNDSFKVDPNKKEPQPNGLGRIRTGDLRRLKAPFRNWSPC